jgi:ribonuclease R
MTELTDIKSRISNFMREDAYKPMKYEELKAAMEIDGTDAVSFDSALEELVAIGDIIETKKKKLGITEKMNLVPGRLQGNKKGFAFLIPNNKDIKDLFIPGEKLNGAMNNDRVIVRLTAGELNTKKSEGEVIRILERANEKIVGVYESSKNFGFVIPDDPRIYQDIFISKGDANGAETGHKVVVEITVWPEGRRNPEGRVVEILGHKDDPGTDIISIIRSHNLPEGFPENVEDQAANIPEIVREDEIGKRRDLRDKIIVTIDGEDAKDLDDAVGVEKLPNGNYLLGVHIADVCHYVNEKSPLDSEAFLRGTSVYLVDRVIPMLPRRLSNGICSLNPQIERLTLSCDMEIDGKGKVVRYDIYESVIKTKERMTYKNVNRILTDKDPETMDRYKDLIPTFELMNELRDILGKRRTTRGSIEFEFQETKIILDPNGKPVEIRPYERGISESIIEEFMLVCNETIAEDMFWKEAPFVYRVHEDPAPEKIEAFNEFIYNFGYHLKGITESVHPKALQQLVEKIKGTREERIISTLMLRSLRKARYTSSNLGHFGLAAKYYCHFTSPIRRYPDLIIHRIIKEGLHGKLVGKRLAELHGKLEQMADHCSIRERVAEEAERDVEDLKKAEFMKDKVGMEFEGIISSVTSFGMFVELENTVEGLIRISNIDDDYYTFDEKHYTMIGERSKRTFRIGDVLKIRVDKVDVPNRNIDFMLV